MILKEGGRKSHMLNNYLPLTEQLLFNKMLIWALEKWVSKYCNCFISPRNVSSIF